ncbi:MAG: quinoprotein dehydrogenase-associated SoxYZ-like carrier, partial [Leptothrix sp. (in: b-proteobacteria)]
PSGDDPEASVRWRAIRASLFGERPIALAGAAELTLSAPRRAEDPAFVPIALRSAIAPGTPQSIRRLTLVIDNNPSPIAAVIDLPADGALPDIETRARLDEYTFVRAIAETADGRLLMATRFVKASGGCSAPAGGDVAAMLAAMGRMRFQLAEPGLFSATSAAGGGDAAAMQASATPWWSTGQPVAIQWQVSHPNHTGMAMDQATRQFTPAHYVRSVRLWQGERLLLTADVDFALSENPTLRWRFTPHGDGDLRAEVTDTRERRYSASLALKDLR